MFTLEHHAEPYWLDLRDGVRVKVRPLGAALLSAVTSYAQRTVSNALTRQIDAEAANLVHAGDIDLNDPDLRLGHVSEAMAIGLARFGILEWDGVGDASGAPLPFAAELAEPFARSGIGLEFLQRYQAPRRAAVAEGNASAPSPSTNSAGGAITAPDATGSAPTAPAT